MSTVTDTPASAVANPFGDAPIVASPVGASMAAAVQREIAEVQAAMVIAKNFPRDQRAAMDRILMDCQRLELAEKAVYQYARGGTDITGPSIRLAEVLSRNWRNLWTGVVELSHAGGYTEMQAYAWDLEANARDEKRFHVKHWRDKKNGGGYVVTDARDIYELGANSAARRKRACILALIPGDVIDAALEQCATTLATKIELTPERVKAMLDKFQELGVSKVQIEKRIQRNIGALTPALFAGLGRIFNSLEDGMSQVNEWFEPEPTPDGGAPAPTTPTTRTESVKKKLEDKSPAANEAGAAGKGSEGPAQNVVGSALGEAGGAEGAPSPGGENPASSDSSDGNLPFETGATLARQDDVVGFARSVAAWNPVENKLIVNAQLATILDVPTGYYALTDAVLAKSWDKLYDTLEAAAKQRAAQQAKGGGK